MTTDDHRAGSFAVTDRPVAAPDVDAARAIGDAVAAIDRTFAGGAEWRSVVASLNLMRRILEEPPRTCRRCGRAWMLDHGVTFALYRRGLPLPKYCEFCRTKRRQERAERERSMSRL